jgi:predicted nucleic acid-binding protein
LIIDASVVFKWFFPEEGHERALEWVGNAELFAPTLLHAELGNALWKRVRRGEIAAAGPEVAEQLARVARVVGSLDETPFVPRAVEMAAALQHPVYDCVYLAVAEARDDRLLTADARFLRALEGTALAERALKL